MHVVMGYALKYISIAIGAAIGEFVGGAASNAVKAAKKKFDSRKKED